MLSSISIENFKAFGKKQKLPIKPITLIFGPNSSGKSSIIHSLLFAQHALETGKLDVFRTSGGGESVDLGGFKQFIFKGNRDNLFTWSVEIAVKNLKNELLEFLSPARTLEISLSMRLPQKEASPGEIVYADTPIVSSFFVNADGKELFSLGARPDNRLRMERLNHEHPVFRNIFKSIIEVSTTVQNILPEDYDYLREGVAGILSKMEFTAEKFIPQSTGKSVKDATYLESSLIPVSRGNRKENILATIELIIPRKIAIFLKDLYNEVQGYFNNLSYLGPLRSYPPRHLAFLESEDHNWYAGGGFAWEVLRKDAQVRKKVNQWLGDKDKLQTPYHLEIKDFVSYEDLSSDYVGEIEDIENKYFGDAPQLDPGEGDMFGELYEVLNKIKKSSHRQAAISELLLKDLRTDTIVSHRDVGIGISQIIPVLVSAYAHQNKMIAIEQPEIHIHPGLQAAIGDIFINSAMGEQKNTFLLETHSEHLILRILRRIRETADGELPKGVQPVRPQDVSVIYVKPSNKGAILHQLPVNEEGEFTRKWPDGFFAERANELF